MTRPVSGEERRAVDAKIAANPGIDPGNAIIPDDDSAPVQVFATRDPKPAGGEGNPVGNADTPWHNDPIIQPNAAPWLNDPIVQRNAAPWLNDPMVQPAISDPWYNGPTAPVASTDRFGGVPVPRDQFGGIHASAVPLLAPIREAALNSARGQVGPVAFDDLIPQTPAQAAANPAFSAGTQPAKPGDDVNFLPPVGDVDSNAMRSPADLADYEQALYQDYTGGAPKPGTAAPSTVPRPTGEVEHGPENFYELLKDALFHSNDPIPRIQVQPGPGALNTAEQIGAGVANTAGGIFNFLGTPAGALATLAGAGPEIVDGVVPQIVRAGAGLGFGVQGAGNIAPDVTAVGNASGAQARTEAVLKAAMDALMIGGGLHGGGSLEDLSKADGMGKPEVEKAAIETQIQINKARDAALQDAMRQQQGRGLIPGQTNPATNTTDPAGIETTPDSNSNQLESPATTAIRRTLEDGSANGSDSLENAADGFIDKYVTGTVPLDVLNELRRQGQENPVLRINGNPLTIETGAPEDSYDSRSNTINLTAPENAVPRGTLAEEFQHALDRVSGATTDQKLTDFRNQFHKDDANWQWHIPVWTRIADAIQGKQPSFQHYIFSQEDVPALRQAVRDAKTIVLKQQAERLKLRRTGK